MTSVLYTVIYLRIVIAEDIVILYTSTGKEFSRSCVFSTRIISTEFLRNLYCTSLNLQWLVYHGVEHLKEGSDKIFRA